MSDPKPLHVVLLNQAFHPDVVATAQMGKDLADALARRGHRVSAVASRSIYGQSGAALPKREEIPVPNAPHPISVHRVGASLFGKGSTLARVLDFALFYALALARLLTLPRPDVVVCYTTPPFIALAGLLSKWLRNSHAVYWVMDLYPDLPVACGLMKPAAITARSFERINRFLLRHSDASVVLGRCMRDRVLAKGIPESKVHLIPVWSDLAPPPDEPTPAENPLRRQWNLADKFIVMYSGNLGLGHDASTICDAILRLRDHPHIHFVFVGAGKRRAEVEAFLRQHNLSNASSFDYAPRDQLAQSLSAADAHLISIKDGIEGLMVPSKLFGIMAVARPALYVGHPSSEVALVLREANAGFCVREGQGDHLARHILALAADPPQARAMGQRARHALLGRYDAPSACAQWINLVESLAQRPTRD